MDEAREATVSKKSMGKEAANTSEKGCCDYMHSV